MVGEYDEIKYFKSMTNQTLKKIDIQKIADEGIKMYEKIKADYEPHHNGKYLAIEIESGKAYLGESGAEAVSLAKSKHPDKYFYLVKIGYDVSETLAQYLNIRTNLR